MADGWEISDFASPWPRGPIPIEAREVELVVSMFQMDARTHPTWTYDEFRATAATYASARWPGDRPIPMPRLTDEEIDRVRAERSALYAQWAAVQPGETLEVRFERDRRRDLQ